MSHGSLVLLIIIHVIFDFLLQSRDTATNKSSNFKYLVGHLAVIYFGLLIYSLLVGYNVSQGVSFALGNTILHGIIDWNIWRLYKLSVIKRFPTADAKFEYYNDSMFYNFIALDQALHGLCYIGLDLLVRNYL